MKICPKCKRRTNADQCDTCDIVFVEYEREKLNQTVLVYKLISAGELERAKALATDLSNEFPDSRGDFVLLISNINRDVNIGIKYQQAQDLFSKGEYRETSLLLRNIKAFDPGLEEKIIALRRKAERYSGNDHKLEQAIEYFKDKRYFAAKRLLLQINDHNHKDEVRKYLSRITEIKENLLQIVMDSLGKNLFDTARKEMDNLIRIFPETEKEQTELLTLLAQRKEISDTILDTAHKARKEGRLLEAKVFYSFLIRQNHELKPALLPYIEEIGTKATVTLLDCHYAGIIDFKKLDIEVDQEGLLKSMPMHQEVIKRHHAGENLPDIPPSPIVPESLADPISEPVGIDGEEVADFT